MIRPIIEFTEVTPTGTGTKTEGSKAQVQEGMRLFTPGHVFSSIPSRFNSAFDNNSTVKEVPNAAFEVDVRRLKRRTKNANQDSLCLVVGDELLNTKSD